MRRTLLLRCTGSSLLLHSFTSADLARQFFRFAKPTRCRITVRTCLFHGFNGFLFLLVPGLFPFGGTGDGSYSILRRGRLGAGIFG
jgi:hypothetical protein